MDWQKMFQAIMLPFALMVALNMAIYAIPIASTYYFMDEYTMTTIYFGLAIAFAAFFGGTAALVWAGYRTAKALQGGAVEGGIGGAMLSVLSSITVTALSFAVNAGAAFWQPSSSTGFAASNLFDINSSYFLIYLLFFVFGTIGGAIWGFLMGAIGGLIARSKQPAAAAAAAAPRVNVAMIVAVVFVAIVLIVGALLFLIIFMFPAPSPSIVCSSSEPTKIVVKAYRTDNAFWSGAEDVGIIKLQNITGGDISIVSCTGSGAFEEMLDSSDGCTASVVSGAEIELKPNSGPSIGIFHSSTIKISYKDYADLPRTVTITCSGPITVS